MSDISAGLFALGGALIGTGGSLGISAMASWTQRQESRRERLSLVADYRREVATDFLRAIDQFIDDARLLNWGLNEHKGDDWLTSVGGRYSSSWRAVASSDAPVQIAGPSELGQYAQDLRSSAADLGNALDAWLEAPRDPKMSSASLGISRKINAVTTKKKAFITQAQDVFDIPALGNPNANRVTGK